MTEYIFDYEPDFEDNFSVVEWREKTRNIGDEFVLIDGNYSISASGEYILIDVKKERAIFPLIDEKFPERTPEGVRILRASCRYFKQFGKTISATSLIEKINEKNLILTINHLEKGRTFSFSTHGPFQQ